jgi:hypothetical protein
MAAPKQLLVSLRWRPITLAQNNLTVRVPWQPEADRGVGITGQAFKFRGEIQ